MKQIFRHLIGEFNGEFLKSLHHFHNIAMDNLVEDFYYWATVQWLPPGKGTSEESEIRPSDASGIAHTAGLFSPVVLSSFSPGSVRFAGPSEEYSEQSVQMFLDGAIKYVANLEGHDISYYATGYGESYTTDDGIKTMTATAGKSSTQVSMVPDDAVPVGYLVPDTVLDSGKTMDVVSTGEDGASITVKMVDTEPVSGIYLPYYGPQYAWLDNTVLIQMMLEDNQALFMELLECMQHIRRNGSSVMDFLELTEVLMGRYLQISDMVQIEGKPYAIQIYYTLDEYDDTIPANERSMRYACWIYFVRLKFPQYRIENGVKPQCRCTVNFDSSISNEWSITVFPADAVTYYTLDGTDPRYSPTRILYDGLTHYITETTHVIACAVKGTYGGIDYATSKMVPNVGDEPATEAGPGVNNIICVPSHLYYDGTIEYDGANTYRG